MLQVDMLGQWRGSAPASAFPLQLGVRIGRGYIGLEDEVLVTEDSDDYLSSVQRELIFVE